MKKIFIATLFLLPLLSITLVPSSSETERWIVAYRVEDLKTKQLILEVDFENNKSRYYAPIFAGMEYNITMMIKIPMSVPYTALTLKTLLEHPTLIDRHWERHSSPPPTLIDYNPNNKSLRIKQEKGTLIVSLFGKVPDKLTEYKITSLITLHHPFKFIAAKLIGPNSQVLDEITLDVIDSKIFEYRNLLKEKKNILQNLKESSPKVAPAYIRLFEDVISKAEDEGKGGFVDMAIDLLNILTEENAPREHVPSILETLFFPAVGGLAIVALIFGFLFLRVRSKVGYISMVIEDQIRELEGLTFRISKIDKGIYSNLDSIKNRLKKLIEA